MSYNLSMYRKFILDPSNQLKQMWAELMIDASVLMLSMSMFVSISLWFSMSMLILMSMSMSMSMLMSMLVSGLVESV